MTGIRVRVRVGVRVGVRKNSFAMIGNGVRVRVRVRKNSFAMTGRCGMIHMIKGMVGTIGPGR